MNTQTPPTQTMTDEALLSFFVDRKTAKILAKRPLCEVMGYTKARKNEIMDEDKAGYTVHPNLAAAKELIARAMYSEMQRTGITIDSPKVAQAFLTARMAHLEHEVFAVLWLDNSHHVLAFEVLFRGTIDSAQVHNREIVKAGLAQNAAACIVTHNHPSGNPEPSQADINMTRKLESALNLVDIRILDHLIVAGINTTSLRERGDM